jgi:hypothetical protein
LWIYIRIVVLVAISVVAPADCRHLRRVAGSPHLRLRPDQARVLPETHRQRQDHARRPRHPRQSRRRRRIVCTVAEGLVVW